jgi:hypothetical protein
MSRKGIVKQVIVVIKGELKEDEFAFCLVVLDYNVKKHIVTTLDRSKIVRKCKRLYRNVSHIELTVLKKYKKIKYS